MHTTHHDATVIRKTAVLIAGGGISGLSAALFLLQQGIVPLLVERHKTTSIHPRARGFDVRTMELYRELQLSEEIRNAGAALAPAFGILTAASLADALQKKKRKKKKATGPMNIKGLEALALQSPEQGARCTQDISEPILLSAALDRGGDIRFYTELISFEQTEEGVSAIIRNRETGAEERLLATYMIAADGAKSPIRTTLDVATAGSGVLGNLLNIYFKADLEAFVNGREFSILRVEEAGIRGMLTSINNGDRWVYHLAYDPEKGEQAEDFTQERLSDILQRVIGLPGLHIDIISVMPWQPTVKAVTEMQHERIFFAGDAAHVMPPYGGKGANTGIQDVHNLAWKLALVLKGKAADSLLHSYSAERQQIGYQNAVRSGAMADDAGLIIKVNRKWMFSFLTVIIAGILRLDKLFPALPMKKLGYIMGFPDMVYTSSAVIPEADSSPAAYTGLLQGQAGTRMPHLWVSYRQLRISTLDIPRKGFILLTGTDNTLWRQAALQTGNELGINIPVFSIGPGADLEYTDKPLRKVLGIADNGALLIRPDGFVAWRCRQQYPEAGQALKRALLRILGSTQATVTGL